MLANILTFYIIAHSINELVLKDDYFKRERVSGVINTIAFIWWVNYYLR